jgi:hypothetical protein
MSREFEFVRQCDEIHKIQDLNEAKQLAITLLRLNRCMRETVAAMVKSEIPEVSLPPI